MYKHCTYSMYIKKIVLLCHWVVLFWFITLQYCICILYIYIISSYMHTFSSLFVICTSNTFIQNYNCKQKRICCLHNLVFYLFWWCLPVGRLLGESNCAGKKQRKKKLPCSCNCNPVLIYIPTAWSRLFFIGNLQIILCCL